MDFHSNTSHVPVYRDDIYEYHQYSNKFKYISCSCLSDVLIFEEFHSNHSNTSHVPVYHEDVTINPIPT